MTPYIDKVFKIFRENYKEIPLEIYKDPYKALISTLLSARTRDEVTLKVCMKLFPKAPTIEKLDALSVKGITELIHGVGFYKTKAVYLKKLANIIIKKFGGKVPKTKGELMELPGVGTKTANLVLNRAFNKPAIAVDTHVHRISNLLGFVNTNTPEKTEKELIKVIPRKYWSEMNKLYVSIGRQYGSGKKLMEFLKTQKLI